jgi:hypothetical protein
MIESMMPAELEDEFVISIDVNADLDDDEDEDEDEDEERDDDTMEEDDELSWSLCSEDDEEVCDEEFPKMPCTLSRVEKWPEERPPSSAISKRARLCSETLFAPSERRPNTKSDVARDVPMLTRTVVR